MIEINQAKSKPDTADRPVRNAHTVCYNVTVAQRQFCYYSPFSRPTSHLRCREVEVRVYEAEDAESREKP